MSIRPVQIPVLLLSGVVLFGIADFLFFGHGVRAVTVLCGL